MIVTATIEYRGRITLCPGPLMDEFHRPLRHRIWMAVCRTPSLMPSHAYLIFDGDPDPDFALQIMKEKAAVFHLGNDILVFDTGASVEDRRLILEWIEARRLAWGIFKQ